MLFMKVICVSGSPGTGKTTLAKKIAKEKGFKYVDVTKIVKSHELYDGYDNKKKCYLVDVKKLNKALIKIIEKSGEGLVIDSHLSHYLPKKYVNLCIITKCDLKVLEKRLKKRGYSQNKIRENLDCEIFDVCLSEAKEGRHKVKVVDTSKMKDLREFLAKSKHL